MAKPIEYGWRTASFEIAKQGVCARVEKFWCTEIDGDEDGWRWSGFTPNDHGDRYEPRKSISEPMSRAQATVEAERWLDEQIENAKGLRVYAFKGA